LIHKLNCKEEKVMKFFLMQGKKFIRSGLFSILMLAVALTGCGSDNSGNDSGGGTTTFIVTYDGNDPDGGSVPVDDTDYQEGDTVTVLGNPGNLFMTGYTCAGWNTQADGGGTTYTEDQTFTMGAADVTLYAVWAPISAGSLDTSFGSAGVVITPSGGMAWGMAIQGDGKILVTGGITVVRYNTDGTLDSDFGSGGIVTLPEGNASRDGISIAAALAIESGDSDDFRIVVAGVGVKREGATAYPRMAAARLNANGSLDTSFAAASVTPGIFYSPFHSNGSFGAKGVAIQDDGKIVLAGETSDRFAVVRLTTTGSLDTTFGSPNGYVTTDIQHFSHAIAVAIQEDGKIVVAGQSYLGPSGSWSNYAASVARYQSNGTLDTANFGSPNGYVFNTSCTASTGLALQNGRILVSGDLRANDEFAILGFSDDGTLDSTFGDQGLVTTRLGDSATAYALAASDDEILLAGRAYIGSSAILAVARYSANGDLDTTFGSPDGYVFTTVGASPYAYGLAIQPSDGKIVVAGGQGQSPSSFFVVRYLP
jgi:uncharacterized delta-60 repeat protein